MCTTLFLSSSMFTVRLEKTTIFVSQNLGGYHNVYTMFTLKYIMGLLLMIHNTNIYHNVLVLEVGLVL